MSIPVIDPEASVLSYKQWDVWEHIFSATNAPTNWSYVSGGIPTGMSFEPDTPATGLNSSDVITAAGHKFTEGMLVMLRDKTGGSGVSGATPYYIKNLSGDDFQLATSVGGTFVNLVSDISAVNIYRPGQLVGAASIPGVYTLRLIATNGSGDSAEVKFTIGIEPAAPSLDSAAEFVWDLDLNTITRLVTSTTTADAAAPLISAKENDDFMARIRLRKGGTYISLAATSFLFGVKELEPDPRVDVSDAFVQEGTGIDTSYLVHIKFDGNVLAGALDAYAADGGTFFDGLGEFEIQYSNPFAIGGDTLTQSTANFKTRITRDLNQ